MLGKKIGQWLIECIYPPCCPFCDQVLQKKERAYGLCRGCQKELVYITNNFCAKCGKRIASGQEELCMDCVRQKHMYDQARSVFSYQGRTREALYRFKKKNRREYAEYFGTEICRMRRRWILSLQVDLLIPVPMHPSNVRMRGYNQAQLLAEVMGRELDLPVSCQILQKTGRTQEQKELDRKQRRKNLEHAFAVPAENRNVLQGKNILLVDDIYTTGATADAAAKVLKQAGVAYVYVVTVASGG